ncbi:MAG: PH domain-containing protein [Proteobacteria bacterium]|nr:PH domain-containing protein [Pseudomonadota bacterium]
MDYTPSRYVRKTLMPDERCVKDARFSWLYVLQAWILWGLCLLFGFAVRHVVSPSLGPQSWYFVAGGAGFGGWLFLLMMLRKWTTEIILTTERLIYKRGFLSVTVEEVDIEQLASDNVDQSIWGRLFDYGQIHVRCIEADDIYLPAITHPYEFRNALEQQKHIYRDTYMKVEHLRRHGMEPGDK